MRLNEAAASTRPGGEQRVGARTAHPDGAGRIPAGQLGRTSPPLLAVSRALAAP
jgi:hypothetical protein